MTNEEGCSRGAVGLALLIGGLAGAAVALLLAPQSGRETRKQGREYARRAEEGVHDLAGTATQAMAQAVDKSSGFIKDTQAIVTEAVKAGRVAMQCEHERLSGEKKT